MALIYTGIVDSFVTLPLLEFGPALQRLDTRWRIAGPDILTADGVVASEYIIFGTGLGTGPGALPSGGTITGVFHYAGLLADNGGSDPFADIVAQQPFTYITGLSLSAAAFAAAAPQARADLLLAGDDAQHYTPLQPDVVGSARFTLRGGDGNDTLYGAYADVALHGEAGDDLIAVPDDGASSPGLVSATIEGGAGDDTLGGGSGADILRGGDGVDRLSGGRGNDTLDGGTERDLLRGGDGNDVLIVQLGEAEPGEVLDGGAGTDRLAVIGAPGQVIDLTDGLLQSIEVLQLSGELVLARAGLETVTRIEFGGLASITLSDPGVTDLTGIAWYAFSTLSRLAIHGSAGRDVIIGRDTADVAPPVDGLVAVGAGDLILGGLGSDVIAGGSGDDSLHGEDGHDRLSGDGGADSLDGGAGNDTLDSGGDGGGGAPDRLAGGAGNDSYVIRTANAVVQEAAGDGAQDLVTAFVSVTLWEEVEDLHLAGAAPLDGTGNATGNALTGNDSANRLDGQDGNDDLFGQGGNDLLLGRDGNDSLDGGTGADTLRGGLGRDSLTGGIGPDLFVFAAASESTAAARERDTIMDFAPGSDRIDLSGVDADPAQPGLQPFTFIGTAAFVTGAPGQLRYEASDTGLTVLATLDADRRADVAIVLQGLAALTAADFVLA